MNPKISVIMPAYNYGHLLPGTIKSVLDQTFGDFELIVINDKSSDNTAEVLASVDDERVRVLSNPVNMGVNLTINRGFMAARGQYCCVLAADDTWPPDSLEQRFKAITKGDFDAVHAGLTRLEDGKEFYSRPLDTSKAARIAQFLDKPTRGYGINNATFMFHRRVFEMVGYRGTSETIFPHNDFEFVLRVLLNCRTSFIDVPSYYYAIHPRSHSDIHATNARGLQNYSDLKRHYSELFRGESVKALI